MQPESRVKKSFLNARVNLIFYFLTLILSFFSRKIFLDCLGADFLGLTGTIGNLLSVLNLAELGIGSAIGYVLYKPLFAQDKTSINEIISVFGYLYRKVGLFILIGGCILACFLPLIYPNTTFELTLIYFAYFSFLGSSLIGYFANYRQTLLGADQKNYVVAAIFQTMGLFKTLIQMYSAYRTGNYYLWIGIELTFGIAHSIILNYKIKQIYPWLESNVRNGKRLKEKYPDVMKYTKQLFIHKIGELVYFQVTPFLLYAFVSLQTVAYYGNYTLVTSRLKGLLGSFLGSTGAGVGNLIAEGDKQKIQDVYWELMSIYFFAVGIFIFSIYHLMPGFINLWLGEKYILSNKILILVLASFTLGTLRGTTDQFLFGFGLFADVLSPFVESFILICVAIIGGYLWGFEGVLLGNIISTLLVIYVWKPYYLFKKGFQKSVWIYWANCLKMLLLMFLSFYIASYITTFIPYQFNIIDNWLDWILYACIITSIVAIIYFTFMVVFTKGMRNFLQRIFILKKRK